MKTNSRTLNGTLFSKLELDQFKSYMTKAQEVANKSVGPVKVGACITDPKRNKILCISYDMRSKHPLQHAVMIAIDLIAKGQRKGAWELPDDMVCAVEDVENLGKSGPYLSTGYDLFVTREPCKMCSMALLHSRIKRVFYGQSVTHGGLGSSNKIHTLSQTNHRFEVWKGLLNIECQPLSIT